MPRDRGTRLDKAEPVASITGEIALTCLPRPVRDAGRKLASSSFTVEDSDGHHQSSRGTCGAGERGPDE